LLHTQLAQGLQQNPFQQNPLQQNPLQQFATPYGQQLGSPYAQQPFISPFAQTGYPLAPQTLAQGWIGARGPWSY
jgi:hypothetical protein